MSSTRSVGVTLARRFNAGKRAVSCSRRVATSDLPMFSNVFSRRDATTNVSLIYPALKRRAKFITTLRVNSA